MKCQKSPLALFLLQLAVIGRFLSMLKNTPRTLVLGRFLTGLKILLFTILFVALASASFAQDAVIDAAVDNLYIEALPSNIQISPCEKATFEFKLLNTGSSEDTFYLGVDLFSEGARLSKNTITLKPNLPQTIKLYLNPSCDVYGTFSIQFLAQSSSGALFGETVTLDIIPNDVIKFQRLSRIKAGYEHSFVELSLANIGPRDSAYFIYLEPSLDWIKVKPESLVIPASSSQTIRIFTLPSEINEEGIYNLELVAKVQNSGIEYTQSFKLILRQAGLIDTSLAKAKSALLFLARQWWKVLLIILALGIGVPLFAVFIIWHSATKELRKERKVQKKEERFLKKAELKRQKELQILKKEQDQVVKQKLAVILKRELRKEFSFIPRGFSFPWLRLAFFAALTGTAALAYAYYKLLWYFRLYTLLAVVVLLFLAVLSTIFRFVRVKRLKSRLKPNALLKLKSALKKEMHKDYDLIPKSTLKEMGSKRWMLYLCPALFFLLVSALSFIGASFSTQIPYFISFVSTSIAVILIFVSLIDRAVYLHNTVKLFPGAVSAKQPLTLATGWTKGLYEISLMLASKAEHASLLIQRFKGFPEKPNARVYQYFEINSYNLEPKEAKLFFAVRKSWLGKEIPAAKVKLMHYTSKWCSVPTFKLKEDENYIHYESIINTLDHVFAIVGACQKEREGDEISKEQEREVDTLLSTEAKKPGLRFLWFALAILFLTSVLSLVFYSSLLEEHSSSELDLGQIEEVTNHVAGLPSNFTTGIPPQKWIENTEHRIDLGRYFQDPDNDDALTFSASPVEHIAVTFDKNTAVLAPEFNWNGQTFIIFTATDSELASVASNPVQLIIEPAPEKLYMKQFIASFKPYLKYFLIGIVLIVTILALFEVRKD